MIKIKVPATTANMGPGFDAIGMALNLYNEVEIETLNEGVQVIWDNPELELPLEQNMVYTSMMHAFEKYDFKCKGVKIRIKSCNIPLSRGLGSSASSIVAGIVGANEIMGKVMSYDDIVDMATELEGHPDNVVPAITGGMVVSIYDGGKVTYSKIDVPKEIRFAVMIPGFKVSTEKARSVMPENYGKSDCVFNISRVAMLVNAMNKGELEKLRVCFEDKIHQPYRKKLIEGMDEIFEQAKKLGSIGEFISGSGSTLIAVVKTDNEGFEESMRKYLSEIDGNWELKMLETDYNGVSI